MKAYPLKISFQNIAIFLGTSNICDSEMVIDQVRYKYQPTSGCEADLEENEREKAQHT